MSDVLTGKQERAAILCAEDELTDEDIARHVGITPRQLTRWKGLPPFEARIREHIAQLGAELAKYHIARKDKRLAALNDRWERAQQVLSARADDPDNQNIPGGPSGLIVKKPLMVKVYNAESHEGDSDHGETLEPQKLVELRYEYAVDTGFLAEMRAMEKQAAQEAGQWADKHEHTGEILIRRYIGVDLDNV